MKSLGFDIAGKHRTVVVSRPAQQPDGRLPLIVDLHGSGLDAAGQVKTTRLEQYLRAVVVRPQAAIPLQFRPGMAWGWAWNVPGVPLYGAHSREAPELKEPDDAAFLAAIVNGELTAWRDVEISEVHLIGFSGGARMASHVAALAPVRSLVAVAGLRPPAGDSPDNHPDVLAIHGRHDQVNPFLGGNDPRWDSPVTSALEAWGGTNGPPVHVHPTDTTAGMRVHKRGRATLIEHLHGGHSWPGTPDLTHRTIFTTSDDLDASALIAEFLESTST